MNLRTSHHSSCSTACLTIWSPLTLTAPVVISELPNPYKKTTKQNKKLKVWQLCYCFVCPWPVPFLCRKHILCYDHQSTETLGQQGGEPRLIHNNPENWTHNHICGPTDKKLLGPLHHQLLYTCSHYMTFELHAKFVNMCFSGTLNHYNRCITAPLTC